MTGEPFSPSQIATILRLMPDERLRAVTPSDFHRWPVRKIVPSKVIGELIANEVARRV